MPIGLEAGDFGGGDTGVTPAELGTRAGTPVVWTKWATAEDERVCPECGPLDGAAWPEGEGPEPPLHDGCRCARLFAWLELSTREGGAG